MFELIDEAVTQSAYDTAMAIFSEYCKLLTMETEGLYLESDYVIQEGSVPERKTVLEKIMFFIPDMLRKFFEFIKKKLNKILGKSQETIADVISDKIKEANKSPENKKKLIAGLAAAGITAAATTTGVVMYNKNKEKVMSFEVDTTGVCSISIQYDIPNMIKSLEESVEVSKDVLNLYSSSDRSAFEKQYKTIANKLNKATESLKTAIKPNESKNSDPNGLTYTVQQLMKELKQLSDSIEKMQGAVKTFDIRSGECEWKNTKYEADTTLLNTSLNNWVNAVKMFIASTSSFIKEVEVNLAYWDINEMKGRDTHSDYAFGYLSAFVTYCSYKSSPRGFQLEAILDPWQSSKMQIEPSKSSFEDLPLSKLISTLVSSSDFKMPCWGHVGNEWFVLLPFIKHYKVKGLAGSVHDDTYEQYGLIFKSPNEFTKAAHFANNVSSGTLASITERLMIPASGGHSGEDNPGCIVIRREVLRALMHATQNMASGLSQDVTPDENEVFCHVGNSYNPTELKYQLRYISDKITVKPVKTKPGVVKITINKDEDDSSD